MIGYVMVGSNDLPRSAAFYDAVLAPLGMVKTAQDDSYAAYAPKTAEDQVEFYVTQPFDGKPATIGNGTMIALAAESLQALDQFHSIAMQNGAVDEGKPGPRDDGSVHYAYVRDPDGNKICAFCGA